MSNDTTNTTAQISRNSALQIISTAFLAVASGFWIINLAVSFGYIDTTSPLYWIGADISTVSTFVFVLLFLFPAIKCLQNARDLKRVPEKVEEVGLPNSPYPEGFTFFLVMLGLAGTLYGLYVGLFSGDIRGTAESGQADAVSMMIDQLLNGAATALLSSLWALVAAFFAASPIRMLYEWACMLEDPIDDDSLDNAVRQLVDDLRSLSVASRIATDNLSTEEKSAAPTNTTVTPAATPTDEAVTSLHEQSLRTNQLLEQLVGLLSQNVEHGARQREATDKALAAYVDAMRTK